MVHFGAETYRAETAATASSQDLVGFGDQIRWESHIDRRCGLRIQMELIRLRVLRRDVARLLAFENLISHARTDTVLLALIRRPRDESSRLDEERRLIHRRHSVRGSEIDNH